MTRQSLGALTCALGMAVGCVGGEDAAGEPALIAIEKATLDEAAERVREAVSPLVDALPVRPDAQAFEASLVGTERAGSYTYVEVSDGPQRRWIAIVGSLDAEPGDSLRVVVFARAEHFTSSRTGRRFQDLGFGLVRRAGDGPARLAADETPTTDEQQEDNDV